MGMVAVRLPNGEHRSRLMSGNPAPSRMAQIWQHIDQACSPGAGANLNTDYSSCTTAYQSSNADKFVDSHASAACATPVGRSGMQYSPVRSGNAPLERPPYTQRPVPSPARELAELGKDTTYIGLPPRYQATTRSNIPADLDLGRYTLVSVIGHGTFGVVVRARDLSQNPSEEVAIKLLPRGAFVKNFKTYVKREVAYQASLRHPLIVSLCEVFLTSTHLALAMDYLPGGDLYRYVIRHQPQCRLSEPQARWIFQQLIIGLDFCHQRGVANRDLKLENLLLDRDGCDGTRPLLKICDFGVSKHVDDSSAKTRVGTPVCMAPEVIYGAPKYDAQKSDIWSCGVILYATVCGQYPFDVLDKHYMKRIISGRPQDPPRDVCLSQNCLHLIQSMLVVEPAKRIALEDIMLHPWFLEDLPPGTLQMNEAYLHQPFDQELLEAVEMVVDAAQHVHTPDEELLSLIFERA